MRLSILIAALVALASLLLALWAGSGAVARQPTAVPEVSGHRLPAPGASPMENAGPVTTSGEARTALVEANLFVVAASSGEQIEGARISLEGGASPITELITDARGAMAPAEWRGATVRVRAAGFIAQRAMIPDGPSATLRLEEAGCVRLGFVNEDGAPVQGIVARLLPPLVGGDSPGAAWRGAELDGLTRESPGIGVTVWGDDLESKPGIVPDPVAQAAWSIEWTQTSGPDGLIEWADLPPGEGYRWALVSPRSVTIEPPAGTGYFADQVTHLIKDPRHSDQLSGAFAVEAGMAAILQSLAFETTCVVGRVSLPMGQFKARLDLAQLESFATLDGESSVLRVLKVGAVDVSASVPAFRFGNVRPGPFRLTGVAVGPGGEQHFLARDFTVEEGLNELEDLGSNPGVCGRFVMELVSSDAAVHDIALDQMFKLEVRSQAGRFDGVESAATFAVHSRLDNVVSLHGLDPARRWIVRATHVEPDEKEIESVRFVPCDLTLTPSSDRSGVVPVPMRVVIRRLVTLEIASADVGWGEAHLNLVNLDGPAPGRAICDEGDAASFWLDPGEYVAYATTAPGPGRRPVPLAGEYRFQVPNQSEGDGPLDFEITLRESCSVALRVDPDGTHGPGTFVQCWYTDATPRSAGVAPVLMGQVGDDCTVRFESVLPGKGLRVVEGVGAALRSGKPGSHTEHTVRLRAR